MKILLFDFNRVLFEVAQELEKRGHTLLEHDGSKKTFKKADVIVVWNETALGQWRDWILDARKKGKRVVLVQHGRRGTSRIFPPFNEELVSDVVCVWGEADRKRLESCGVDPSKIFVTGTPVLRHIKSKIPHEGTNIVFSPEHWDKEVAENVIVASALRKIKKVKVITKILENEHYPELYDNPVISHRQKPDHLDICAEVLRTADLVVAISESTFELMAEIMDIPVVIADIWVPKACDGDERYRDYHREYSDACTRVKDISKIPDVIKQELRYPQRLSAKRSQIAILDGGTNLPDPISNIISVILNEVKT